MFSLLGRYSTLLGMLDVYIHKYLYNYVYQISLAFCILVLVQCTCSLFKLNKMIGVCTSKTFLKHLDLSVECHKLVLEKSIKGKDRDKYDNRVQIIDMYRWR